MSASVWVAAMLICGAVAGYALNRIALYYLERYSGTAGVYSGFAVLLNRNNKHHPLAADMIILETAASLLSAAAVFLWSGAELVFLLCIIYLILLLSLIDNRIRILPNRLNAAGILIGMCYAFFREDFGPADAVVGILTGGGFAAATAFAYQVLRRREGLGFGDVKLLAFFGSFAGWEGVLLIIMAGSLCGAVWGLFSAPKEGNTLAHEIPFGPFLGLAALGYLFLFI